MGSLQINKKNSKSNPHLLQLSRNGNKTTSFKNLTIQRRQYSTTTLNNLNLELKRDFLNWFF